MNKSYVCLHFFRRGRGDGDHPTMFSFNKIVSSIFCPFGCSKKNGYSTDINTTIRNMKIHIFFLCIYCIHIFINICVCLFSRFSSAVISLSSCFASSWTDLTSFTTSYLWCPSGLSFATYSWQCGLMLREIQWKVSAYISKCEYIF